MGEKHKNAKLGNLLTVDVLCVREAIRSSLCRRPGEHDGHRTVESDQDQSFKGIHHSWKLELPFLARGC